MTNEYVVNGAAQAMPNPMFTDLMTAVLDKGAPFRFEASGSSMIPFIRDADVITISKTPMRICMGDVVAFPNPSNDRLTVHRVINFSHDRILVKGDNTSEPDGWIASDRILGYVTRVERKNRRVQFGLDIERVVIALLSRTGLLITILVPIRWAYRSILKRLIE